jgi:hypothetical protein
MSPGAMHHLNTWMRADGSEQGTEEDNIYAYGRHKGRTACSIVSGLSRGTSCSTQARLNAWRACARGPVGATPLLELVGAWLDRSTTTVRRPRSAGPTMHV